MANVLIAGGAGYLGTWITKKLLEGNHRVRVLDRCFFGEKPLEPFRSYKSFELFKGDIRWPAPDVFKNIDVLIDVSGLSNDPSCLVKTELTLAINRDGSINLAKLAKHSGVKRMVFASSCSVYGQGVELTLSETSPTNPVSLYAQSKLMVEEFLFNNLNDADFPVTALRPGTLYGLSNRMRFDLVVNIMTARAVKEKKIFVNGGGEQWRPLVHVEDAADVFVAMAVARKEPVGGEVFNLGSDEQNFRIITLANMVKDVFPDAALIKVPEDKDTRTYRVSFGKLKKAINFTPRHNVPESIIGIRDALAQGVVSYIGPEDDLIHTTLRYVNLTKENPMLEDDGKYKTRRSVEFYRHSIDESDIRRAEQTLRSVFLTTAGMTKRFENALAGYLGVGRALGTTSCTESLFLALKALGIGEGDEVITTPMTFVATANAIEHTGARPVFVDVEETTGNIDAGLIEGAVTERTKAVIPVHLYGHMCDMRAIAETAKRRKLKVIEDAAHCLEGVRDGVRPGQLSDAACFSFYATKNITSGEGGAIATGDDALADLLLKLRLHGLSSDAASRYTGKYKHWNMDVLGYKANMTDIDASLLIGQLLRVDELLARREAVATRYEGAFAGIPGLSHPAVLANTRSARHLFTVWVEPSKRDEALARFQEMGVGVAVNYRAVHLLDYYAKKYNYKRGAFPVAERIGDSTISIPLYPHLTSTEVEYVISTAAEIMTEMRR